MTALDFCVASPQKRSQSHLCPNLCCANRRVKGTYRIRSCFEGNSPGSWFLDSAVIRTTPPGGARTPACSAFHFAEPHTGDGNWESDQMRQPPPCSILNRGKCPKIREGAVQLGSATLPIQKWQVTRRCLMQRAALKQVNGTKPRLHGVGIPCKVCTPLYSPIWQSQLSGGNDTKKYACAFLSVHSVCVYIII